MPSIVRARAPKAWRPEKEGYCGRVDPGLFRRANPDTRAAGKLVNFVFPLRRTPSGREAHEGSCGCEHFLFSARSLSA